MKRLWLALLYLLCLDAAAQTAVTTTGLQVITGKKVFAGADRLCLKDPSDSDLACIVSQALSGAATITLPAVTGTLATLADIAASGSGDFSGPSSATDGAFVLFDGTTGKLGKNSSAPGTGVMTFLATPSSANLASALTDETGSGAAVFATSPTLVTPVLGVATATSINKVAITAPATSATLTIANGKTATVNNSITFAGTDSTTMTFPSTTATIARTDAANTFTGDQAFGTTFVWDSANVRLNLGGATTTANRDVFLQKTVAGIVRYYVQNLSNGTTAQSGYTALNDAGTSPVSMLTTSSGWTTAGLITAGDSYVSNAGGNMLLMAGASGKDLILAAGGTAVANEGLRIKSGIAVTRGYTVATLPTGTAGGRAHVTDQLTACPAIGAALTGGGAVTCPVFYNGSAWVGG